MLYATTQAHLGFEEFTVISFSTTQSQDPTCPKIFLQPFSL